MLELLALVRALVCLEVARMLAPTCPQVGDAFAAAWVACRARFPHLAPGRLSQLVYDRAAARVALWRRDAALDLAGELAMRIGPAPANDTAHVDGFAELCPEGLEHIAARDTARGPFTVAMTGEVCDDFDAYLEREAAAMGCTPEVLCAALALPDAPAVAQ